MITARRAHELLRYEPETGKVFWRVTKGKAKKNKEAGSIHSKGYVQTCLDEKKYFMHRIVWLMSYGNFPCDKLQINHINEVKNDNRLENLQAVSASENMNHGTRNARHAKAMTGKKQSPEHIAAKRKANNKPIFCVTNKVTYLSRKEAASKLGLNYTMIIAQLKGKIKHAGGYTFTPQVKPSSPQ
jgi:hypothetical protein